MDGATIRPQFTHDQIKKRGLAGPVRANDQPPLSWLDDKIDAGSDVQSAERLAEMLDSQRRHCCCPALFDGTVCLPRNAPDPIRHSRAVPGTRPSGMKMTIATKIAPNIKFQRSI